MVLATGIYREIKSIRMLNSNALKIAKTLWSFGHSKCIRVKYI